MKEGNELDEEKINLYLNQKTPVFVKVGSSEEFRMYNGFIIENNTTYILLQDYKLGKFPILKGEILKLEVSEKINDKNEVIDNG